MESAMASKRPKDERTKVPGVTKRWKRAGDKWVSVYRAQVRLKSTGYDEEILTFDKLSDARDWKASTESQMKNGTWISPKDKVIARNNTITLKQAMLDFIEDKHWNEISGNLNVQKELSDFKMLMENSFTHHPVTEYTPQDFDDFILQMDTNITYNYSASTTNNKISAMSRVFDWLIEYRRDEFPTLTNYAKYKRIKLEKGRSNKKKPPKITPKIEDILTTNDFFLILMETAMRRSELAFTTCGVCQTSCHFY